MAKFILSVLGAGFIIIVLIIATLMWPKSSCSVEWLDSDLERFKGPFSECPESLDKVQVGTSHFVRFGSEVYRVDHRTLTEPAGFPCMTGVTCFPIPQGRETWESFRFIRLEGPVELGRLKAYLGGSYMSDGTAVFAGLTRFSATARPIDPTRLEWLPCTRSDGSGQCQAYATDGTYVLDQKTIVMGADPGSFRDDLPALSPDGDLESSSFARDRKSVYAYGRRIDGADPLTFGVLKKDGIIGFDRRHAWRDAINEVERQDVTPHELQQLRSDLESARAIRSATR